ncbi:hypothetical protein PLICRDRAFT_115514, partial [Plicaturopsis crispa FD-325 SS-3]
KLGVRLRKRNAMPEGAHYRDAKYDTAFVASLMSDDEDEYVEGKRVNGRYVSRPPVWRSAEMIALLSAVDKATDPTPQTKYNPRVRGEPQEGPPKASTKLVNRARRWMVDDAWLAKDDNKDFDVERRIMASGRAWGDAEDPEEGIAKRKYVEEEKKTEKKRKRLTMKKEEDGTSGAKKLKTRKKKSTKKSKGSGKGKARATTADLDSDDIIDESD